MIKVLRAYKARLRRGRTASLRSLFEMEITQL